MERKKLRAVLIDDEPDANQQLKDLLAEFDFIEVVEMLESTANALALFKNANFDLLFLDIQMPGQNGIDFLKELASLRNAPKVIMVTAYEQHMLEAFRSSAFDYILKPVDRNELKQCMQRCWKSFEGEVSQDFNKLLSTITNKISIPGTYETQYINPEDIFYLKADGRYTDIVLTTGKTITITSNLGKLEEQLEKDLFIRISRSVIINAPYLVSKNKSHLVIEVNGLQHTVTFSKRFF